ncbi:MAG: methyltransferase domain-containing protein [Bdellovibrionaceae bacterium]|nr:methyltransferase domain-containing protein [Pseudobdellovibrionaceae bacterium]
MTATGSYQFELLEGRSHEANMLVERAQMRLDGFTDLLKRHGFPEQGRALEVGTAQGIRARLMAEHFPNTHVTAIDRSNELLINTPHHTNLSFEQADLYELPFPDEHFNFVYARLVFMHLTDPLKAIASLKRVLKPGGRLLIEDADRDCMFFEPAPASFASFWNKVQDGQRRLGGDPNVGRKLATYLKHSGFSNVTTEVQTILGAGPDIEFLVRTLMPSLNIYLDPKDRASGHLAINDLYTLSQNPNASFYHFWFVVSGGKA